MSSDIPSDQPSTIDRVIDGYKSLFTVLPYLPRVYYDEFVKPAVDYLTDFELPKELSPAYQRIINQAEKQTALAPASLLGYLPSASKLSRLIRPASLFAPSSSGGFSGAVSRVRGYGGRYRSFRRGYHSGYSRSSTRSRSRFGRHSYYRGRYRFRRFRR